MRHRAVLGRMSVVLGIALLCPVVGQAQEEEPLRLGLIGLDTSHVMAFVSRLNDPEHEQHVPGMRIVAGYKGGSDDFPPSYERVDNFTEQLVNDWDVTLYDSIEALCAHVDAVLLTSVDGRQHLAQAKPVIEAGLPLFVDKPFAGSLEEAIEIFDLAEAHDVPLFTSSALRFWEPVVRLSETEDIRGAAMVGPCAYQPGIPELYWYGIHGVEVLFSVMGKDCIAVSRTSTEDTDLLVGTWADERIATFRGIRNAAALYRLSVFGADEVVSEEISGNYQGILEAIRDLFQHGDPAVCRYETLAIFAFLDAAEASKAQGGAPVKLAELLAEAEGR